MEYRLVFLLLMALLLNKLSAQVNTAGSHRDYLEFKTEFKDLDGANFLVVNTRNEGLIKTLGGFSIVAGIAVGLSSFGIATIGMHREAGIGAVVASGLIVLGM
jgi:hypothetical protein